MKYYIFAHNISQIKIPIVTLLETIGIILINFLWLI